MNKVLSMLRVATFATLAAGVAIATPIANASANTPSGDGCSYRDADVNDGCGYNTITGSSCAPRPNADVDHLVIQFKGTAQAVPTDYDTDGDGVADTTSPCFEAPIFDPATGTQIGLGSDCLEVESNDEGNIRLTGTGFFELADGMIAVQGLTTVRPVLQPTRRGGIEFTHITGANSDSGLLYGTGRYQGATGAVRLSGQVDMSRLDSDGVIHFDCIFIIDFT